MNLNQLLYFSVTARHQHFTRAAEELFISQPSLSYAISSLEDELGHKLFEKKGRNVALTKQGVLFLAHVERALREIQQGREALSRMTSETKNQIEVAAFSTSLGPESLPQILRSFKEDAQNTDVVFHFTQSNDIDMLSGLKSMKYDIAFPAQRIETPDIEFIPFLTRQLAAIVPLTHPLCKEDIISLNSLAQHPILLLENSPSAHCIQRMLPELNIASTVQDHMSLLSLAAENFGVAICVPTRETQLFNLRSIPISTPNCCCTINIAYKKNRYFPPALERFITHLKSRSEPQ